MTQPKSVDVRLGLLETAQTAMLERLNAIDTRLAALVAPDTILGMSERVAGLESRVTALEMMLAEKIPTFEKVGSRVSELSAAYLAANERLTQAEANIQALQAEQPAPAEERILSMEKAVATLTGEVGSIKASRGRVGLSSRLSGIEEALAQILAGQQGGGNNG